MKIFRLIKKKIANYIKDLKEFREEDLFAVSIDDDFDSAANNSKKIITLSDNKFGDEENGIMSN